ncbi:hypothetical protein HRI_000823800 [Hibiscus trionum]|uniref:Uncharacterized protein n=1 Tax=Hibiscus trionum TaxID=183268 RepID=A0A9W7H908_HIBTR|nr:hypothetical protein HRI_000823800 [Hibiscus trionum]
MAQIKTPTGVQTEYEPTSQANHPYGNRIPSPSAPPAPPAPFPTQAAWWPTPQGPQTHGHVMVHSNEPNNQHAIYQQQQRPYPQPPSSSFSLNIAQQPFASGYVSHPQANYQAPPQYVVMAPYVASGVLQPVEGWKTGLFDCMDDPINALITVCFPCVTFGQVAEIVDEGRTSCATNALLYGLIAFLIGIPCILSCGFRTKLRNNYRLVESPAPDWVIHCLCEWCALCQEYRELHLRGLDPSIGWHGNLERRPSMKQQQQQFVLRAPMNQTMMA